MGGGPKYPRPAIAVRSGRQLKPQTVGVSNLPIQRPADGLLWCPLVFAQGQDVEDAGHPTRLAQKLVQDEGQTTDGW